MDKVPILGSVLVLFALLLTSAATRSAAQEPATRLVFQNAQMAVFEITLPARFDGEVHTAPFDEAAYVLDGELTVVTVPSGREVVRPGEIAWASKGTIHKSLNATDKPTKFLVIVLT
jgi:quercetin dioxygenase-like cupin family protein